MTDDVITVAKSLERTGVEVAIRFTTARSLVATHIGFEDSSISLRGMVESVLSSFDQFEEAGLNSTLALNEAFYAVVYPLGQLVNAKRTTKATVGSEAG